MGTEDRLQLWVMVRAVRRLVNRELLVFGALLIVLMLTACRTDDEPFVPQFGVQVAHYDVWLEVDPDLPALRGEVRFDVQHPDTLPELRVLAGTLQIETATSGGERVDVQRAGRELLVPLAGDTATSVHLTYSGHPPEGLYADYYRGGHVVYSDSWPYRGEHWLPAVHHPSMPATWHLTLVHPPGYVPVASGEQTSIDTVAHAIHSRWTLGTPAPTYSLAFALGAFRELSGSEAAGIPIRHYVLDDVQHIPAGLQRTGAMVATFTEHIGPYPYEAYSSVQVPLPWVGMENASTAFLQADLYDQPYSLEEVQAHEAAHQWFGNRVSIADWRDLWLSEGITTYLTTVFYEMADGDERAREARARMTEISRSDRRSHHVLVPEHVRDPMDHLTWVPYRKGGSVAHLLRLTMGDGAFFRALQEVYRRHGGEPLSTEQFHDILQEIHAGDLGGIFEHWVYADELPELVIHLDSDEQALHWSVAGDGGVLESIPWELELCESASCRVVDARDGYAHVQGSAMPRVRPVGVLLDVQRR